MQYSKFKTVRILHASGGGGTYSPLFQKMLPCCIKSHQYIMPVEHLGVTSTGSQSVRWWHSLLQMSVPFVTEVTTILVLGPPRICISSLWCLQKLEVQIYCQSRRQHTCGQYMMCDVSAVTIWRVIQYMNPTDSPPVHKLTYPLPVHEERYTCWQSAWMPQTRRQNTNIKNHQTNKWTSHSSRALMHEKSTIWFHG